MGKSQKLLFTEELALSNFLDDHGCTLLAPRIIKGVISKLTIESPSRITAFKLARQFRGILSHHNCPVFIHYPIDRNNDTDTLVIQSNGKTTMTNADNLIQPASPLRSVQFSEFKVTRRILAFLDYSLSHPEISIGLVRLRDQWQCTCSGGAGGKFLADSSGNGIFSLPQVTSWRREQYWHPNDLEEFVETYSKGQAPVERIQDGEWLEYQYRVFDPVVYKSVVSGKNNCDRRMITRYKILDDGFGEYYQIYQNLDQVVLSS